MKIVSWNILANEFIKQSYYPMIKAKMLFNRKGRLRQITSILQNINADVMLLQEVMRAEYNFLSEIFKKEYYIIKGNNIHWENVKCYSGNVTFLRKNMFSLSNVLISDLDFGLYIKCYYLDKKSEGPKNVCENICIIKKPEKKSVEKSVEKSKNKLIPIDIINIHLNDLSHAKRLAEIKSIEEEIQQSKKVILGGDFNQDYKEKSNLYKMLIKEMGLKIYIKDPTYFIEKSMCIDHIMTKGIGGESCGCVVNNFGDNVLKQFNEYGSDHLPIIIKV